MPVFNKKVDLCLVTTTETELHSAKKVLKNITGSLDGPFQCLRSDTKKLATMVFSTAWKRFFDDGRSLEVALVRAGDQRGHKATDFVESLSHTPLEPSVIAMVGVCAGNPKLVQLGDLLVPKAISLDDGKQYAGGRQGRTETIPIEIDETLKGIAGVIEEDGPWLEYVPEELKSIKPPVSPKEERPPKIHMNEFVSGDNLKETADWDAMAERVGRKLTGYEMEGFGFYYGCNRYLGSSKRIFVKGVSDYASKDTKISDKSYQKYCCASATALVFHLAKLGDVSLFGTDFPVSIKTSQTSSRQADHKDDKKTSDTVLFSTGLKKDDSLKSDSFPTDDAPVSDDLINACALINESLWENLGASLLSQGDLQYIREHFDRNYARMVEVLKTWKNAKSPKVGQLLGWFQVFDVNRRVIEMKYKLLCGRK